MKQNCHKRFAALFTIDLRSLALFRMGLALCILADVCTRCGDLLAHYTDRGIYPRAIHFQLAEDASSLWSIHTTNGTTLFIALLFLLQILAACFLLLGWRSRWATFACWLLACSLRYRNPYVCNGGDVILVILLFWSLFLPLGARYSLDAARNRTHPLPQSLCSPATAALLLQVCLIYWVSALTKFDPSWRTEGTALQDALFLESFHTPLSPLVAELPGAWLRFFTISTLYLEEAGPVLALLPFFRGWLRAGMAVTFMAFHLLGIAAILNIGLFPLICAVAWLPFLPACIWRGRRSRTVLWEQPRPPSQFKVVDLLPTALLAYIFCWNLATISPVQFGALMPEKMRGLGRVLGIDQNWRLFAPRVVSQDGWILAPATLEDGSEVDLWTAQPLTWEKPPSLAQSYPNARWRKYIRNMVQKDQNLRFESLVVYLEARWNRLYPDKPVVESRVYYMLIDRDALEEGIQQIQLYPITVPPEDPD